MSESPQTPDAATTPAVSLATEKHQAAHQASLTRLRQTEDNLFLLKSLFLALVFTAVFYEIFPLPLFSEQRLVDLFDNWVSETIVGMTAWSLFLLGFKYLRFRREQQADTLFAHATVKAVFAQGVFPRDMDQVLARLNSALAALAPKGIARTTIHQRVLALLRFVRATPTKEALQDMLNHHAEVAYKRMEASYVVLQVFIWAIPILGFIGTVLGIAQAVYEFSDFIQTVEQGAQFNTQMRTALGGVTGGLAVAFNTTFLALVLVIPVMLATTFLQKLEEEMLLTVEEYCMEEILPHLQLTLAQAGDERFEEHLLRLQQLSQAWATQLEPLVQNLALKSDALGLQMGGVQPLIKNFTDALLTHWQRLSPPRKPGDGE